MGITHGDLMRSVSVIVKLASSENSIEGAVLLKAELKWPHIEWQHQQLIRWSLDHISPIYRVVTFFLVL